MPEGRRSGSFFTHFLLKAASSRGSRMFSCGSQLLCLKETETQSSPQLAPANVSEG